MNIFNELGGKVISPLAQMSEAYPMMNNKDLVSPIESVSCDFSRLPRSMGQWGGEPGNSVWLPDKEINPQVYNPENKSFGEILKEQNIDGIPFKNGYPDFSEVSKGTVEISDFTAYRDANFNQATEALAKEKGCSSKEVQDWMDNHGYTWHECEDCKTMMKVPSELHGNIAHVGGISEYKNRTENQ
ncbi:MAG: HNH endonuclease [Bacteroidales bacterium]|nr:HNH endonuclease [Bacteroidales bacterium]